MKNPLIQTKPNWCANPIITDRGWVDGDTGELLVAIRDRDKKLGPTEPVQPAKTGRGRPRKYPRPDGSM